MIPMPPWSIEIYSGDDLKQTGIGIDCAMTLSSMSERTFLHLSLEDDIGQKQEVILTRKEFHDFITRARALMAIDEDWIECTNQALTDQPNKGESVSD